MDEYISREAALDHGIKVSGLTNEQVQAVKAVIEPYLEYLDKLPAADVRPVKHGHWILDSDPGEPWRYVCSECGEKTTDTCMGEPRANFCPFCGAVMRGLSMKRLTGRTPDGTAYLYNMGGTNAAIDRLAAYEDTGLEPEEIREYLDATGEYVEASEEGRLVVLPRKEEIDP